MITMRDAVRMRSARTRAVAMGFWSVVAVVAVGCATGTQAGTGGAGGGVGGTGGGAGGTGGGQGGCGFASQCPAPADPCMVATCTAGACGAKQAPAGTVVMKNVPADCHAIVCDAMGGTTPGVDLTNVPQSNDPCLAGTCDTAGSPGTTPAVAGTPCTSDTGGQLCDGAGSCVECLHDADCPPDHTCGVLGTCMGSPCMDGVLDGAETDVDCGGGTCPTCAGGKACKVGSDCDTGACDAIMHTCLASMCFDQQKDGNETDVDCGGACAGCPVGKVCFSDQDCATQACDALTLLCVADQCGDHQLDGHETDVDCGGVACPPCAAGKACMFDADCGSGHCDNATHQCSADPCTDGVKDFAESDVDCGGGACPTCAVGRACNVNFDCASQACDAITLVCVADPCNDHHKDGVETDVDCGGAGTCARCAAGKKCLVTSDCAAGLTCPTGTPKVCN